MRESFFPPETRRTISLAGLLKSSDQLIKRIGQKLMDVENGKRPHFTEPEVAYLRKNKLSFTTDTRPLVDTVLEMYPRPGANEETVVTNRPKGLGTREPLYHRPQNPPAGKFNKIVASVSLAALSLLGVTYGYKKCTADDQPGISAAVKSASARSSTEAASVASAALTEVAVPVVSSAPIPVSSAEAAASAGDKINQISIDDLEVLPDSAAPLDLDEVAVPVASANTEIHDKAPVKVLAAASAKAAASAGEKINQISIDDLEVLPDSGAPLELNKVAAPVASAAPIEVASAEPEAPAAVEVAAPAAPVAPAPVASAAQTEVASAEPEAPATVEVAASAAPTAAAAAPAPVAPVASTEKSPSSVAISIHDIQDKKLKEILTGKYKVRANLGGIGSQLIAPYYNELARQARKGIITAEEHNQKKEQISDLMKKLNVGSILYYREIFEGKTDQELRETRTNFYNPERALLRYLEGQLGRAEGWQKGYADLANSSGAGSAREYFGSFETQLLRSNGSMNNIHLVYPDQLISIAGLNLVEDLNRIIGLPGSSDNLDKAPQEDGTSHSSSKTGMNRPVPADGQRFASVEAYSGNRGSNSGHKKMAGTDNKTSEHQNIRRQTIAERRKALFANGVVMIPQAGEDIHENVLAAIKNVFIMECSSDLQQQRMEAVLSGLGSKDLAKCVAADGEIYARLNPQALSQLKSVLSSPNDDLAILAEIDRGWGTPAEIQASTKNAIAVL